MEIRILVECADLFAPDAHFRQPFDPGQDTGIEEGTVTGSA
jgi:hypothetical protein